MAYASAASQNDPAYVAVRCLGGRTEVMIGTWKKREGDAVATPRDAMRALREQDAGEKVSVQVLRDRKPRTVEVTVPDAPPLRYILSVYPPESLAEDFRAGIHVGHEDMPDFVFGDLGIDVLFCRLLAQRGITTREEARFFLKPGRNWHDPFLMADMDRANSASSLALPAGWGWAQIRHTTSMSTLVLSALGTTRKRSIDRDPEGGHRGLGSKSAATPEHRASRRDRPQSS